MKSRIAIILAIVMSVMTTSVFAADQNRKLIIDTMQGLDKTDLSGKDPILMIDDPLHMVDWTVGTDVGAKKGGGLGALVLSSYGPSDNNSIEIVIRAEAFKILTDSAKDNGVYQFALDYPLGAMRIIGRKDLASFEDGEFKFKFQKQNADILSKVSKAVIGERPIVGFNLKVNEKEIKRLNGGLIIEIPYELSAGEKEDQLALYRVEESGELSQVKNSKYNQNKEWNGDKPRVEGLISEPGDYAVGYKTISHKDVYGWYESPASFVLARGIMNDVNGLFMPKNSITRADLAFYLSNMSDQSSEVSSNKFSDISTNHPYKKSINWAYSAGLIKGYEDGTFKPDQVITRQELAVMLNRYTQIIGKSYMPRVNKKESFKDDHKISSFAKESVSSLQQANVIGGRGNGYFVPGDHVTRAECAKMIQAVMGGIMEGKTKFIPMN